MVNTKVLNPSSRKTSSTAKTCILTKVGRARKVDPWIFLWSKFRMINRANHWERAARVNQRKSYHQTWCSLEEPIRCLNSLLKLRLASNSAKNARNRRSNFILIHSDPWAWPRLQKTSLMVSQLSLRMWVSIAALLMMKQRIECRSHCGHLFREL